MNAGMLWFMKPDKSLGDNIAQAASYYERKYGRMPTLCLAHPSCFDQTPAKDSLVGEENVAAKITVRPYRPVLPGHLWIGVEDEKLVQEDKPS